MSDEFHHNPDNNYSSFWPLFILIIGLFLWFGYQDWAANRQRIVYDKQFQAMLPTLEEAQKIGTRYVAVMKDLVQTSAKDPVAGQIVKDAIKAGLIHIEPNATNSVATPAAPAPTSSQ